MPSPNPIIVREVWATNLEDELNFIHQSLRQCRVASFDTEFPGSIFTTQIPFSQLSPIQLYSLMKQNVDSLKLIQLGLTLSDFHGNLPTFGIRFQYIWQFNFRDFDPDTDRQDPESVAFLKNQGIDFAKNRAMGIDSRTFASKFNEYGLGRGSDLTWATFHGIYDYGYVIKILTDRQLPNNYEEFKILAQGYFGYLNYDTKVMAKELGMCGGLEKIAEKLNVERVAGRSRQAGSDSLLTMHVFLKLSGAFFPAPAHVFHELRTRLSPFPVQVVNHHLYRRPLYVQPLLQS